MKWLITSLLSVVLVYAAHAQPQTYRDQLTGLVHIINSDLEIEGTPFLFEDWIPATVKTRLDKYFYGVKVKFDVHQNKFLFNSNDTAYEFVTDIEYFELHPNTSDTTKKLIYKKGFSYANRLNATEYVQVLAEGQINVVKKITKTIQEYQAYSKPTTQKKFVDDVAYFFIGNGNATTNKPSKKILEELTKDKWEQVNTYLKSSALNPKNEQDFAKLIQYYNGLN
jgi:hypothetical protein